MEFHIRSEVYCSLPLCSVTQSRQLLAREWLKFASWGRNLRFVTYVLWN